jgi:hypothetical protein
MQQVWGHRPHGAKEMGELIPIDFVGRGHQSGRVSQMTLTNRMHMNRDVQGGKISGRGRVIQMNVGQQNPGQFVQGPAQVGKALLQSREG